MFRCPLCQCSFHICSPILIPFIFSLVSNPIYVYLDPPFCLSCPSFTEWYITQKKGEREKNPSWHGRKDVSLQKSPPLKFAKIWLTDEPTNVANPPDPPQTEIIEHGKRGI